MELNTLKDHLVIGALDDQIRRVYAADPAELQSARTRLASLVDRFQADFGGEEAGLFSAPGRTEMGGNHTDHQRGHVLAGSVNLDMAACAGRNGLRIIRVLSDGYPQLELDSAELDPTPTITSFQSSPEVLSTMAQPSSITLPLSLIAIR